MTQGLEPPSQENTKNWSKHNQLTLPQRSYGKLQTDATHWKLECEHAMFALPRSAEYFSNTTYRNQKASKDQNIPEPKDQVQA